MDVLSANAFKLRDRFLRSADGGEFSDEVIRVIQCLKFGRAGMGEMVEIIRLRNDTFQLLV